jgi:hypothetical protein
MLNSFKPAAELERSDQENRRTGKGKRSGTIILGAMLITFAVCAHHARAVELITNGGFEAGGGSFAAWTVVNQAGSFPGSNWFIQSGTVSPTSGFPVPAPARSYPRRHD